LRDDKLLRSCRLIAMDGVDHLRDLNVEGSITVKLILNVARECGQDLFG